VELVLLVALLLDKVAHFAGDRVADRVGLSCHNSVVAGELKN